MPSIKELWQQGVIDADAAITLLEEKLGVESVPPEAMSRQQLWYETIWECVRQGKILLPHGGLDPQDLYVVMETFREKL